MIETDKKRDLILEKALVRFSHFGIQKTTMNEIAEDMAISKPSLYYYFPDKISLVLAVTEGVMKDYLLQLHDKFNTAADTLTAVFEMIDLRKTFFQKYFMLHINDFHHDSTLNNDAFRTLMLKGREEEIKIVKGLLASGVKNAEIRDIDTDRIADLLIDALMGINICVLAKQEKQLIPDGKGIDEASEKQKELARIFLDGIKN